MKKIIFFMLVSFVVVNAQDMTSNSYASLFSDLKANKLGDAITILVIESSQASNNAQTSAGRESEIGFGLSGSFGGTSIPGGDANIGTGNQFNGSGSTKTTGLVRTKISAVVDSLLPNGNLHVKGSRKIIINGEEQIITINGIVRTSDIMADNTVLSYNISEAEIVFEGSGIINDAQSSGWLTKFFHWLF